MSMTKEMFEELSITGKHICLLKFIKDCDCDTNDRTEGDKIIVINKDEVDSWELTQDIQDGLDTHAEDELKDSFENVTNSLYCDKCFSLGSLFFPTVFKKIRYTNNTKTNKEFNAINNNLNFYLQNEATVFYLPAELKSITQKDYIATLKHDELNNLIEPIEFLSVYKIYDIIENQADDFIYLTIIAKKITVSQLENIKVGDYVNGIEP